MQGGFLLFLVGQAREAFKTSGRYAPLVFRASVRPTLRQMPFIGRFAPSNKHLSSLAFLERLVIWPWDDLFLSLVGQSKYCAPSDAVHRSLRSLEQTSVVARLFGAFRDLALWQPLLDPCRAMKRRVRWA